MSEHEISHSEAHRLADAEVHEHDPVAHVHVNYWTIFYALCALTAVSVIADLLGGHGVAKIVIVLAVLTIACFKAMFVMLYFMHLKFEGRWKLVLLAPTMVLAVTMIAALMPDIGLHYYDLQIPQTAAVAEQEHHDDSREPGEHDKPAAEH